MRPVKLTLCAFNSYARKQEISFEPFGREGLFLIAGPTGSGKTTIFDGIMFALFGTACSADRQSDMVRSLVCDPKEETYVELEFESQQNRYTIRRSPRYSRKAKRGSGMVDSPAAVSLDLPDGTTLTKAREVDKKIQELIGLDKNQFRQVALLAQGDFRKILTGDTAGRIKILRSLFGTDRFERLETKLKERLSAAAAQESALRSHIQNTVHSIEGYTCEVFVLKDFREFLLQEEEQLRQKTDQQAVVQKELELIGRQIGQLEEKNKAYHQWEQARKTVDQTAPLLQAATRHKEMLEEQQPAFHKKQLEVQETQKALEQGKQKEQLTRRIEQLKEQAQELQKKQKEHQQQIEEDSRREIRLREELAACSSLEEKQKELARLEDLWQQTKLAYERKQQLEQQTETASRAYHQALEHREQLENQEKAARQAYLAGQAGLLALNLQEDSPCPVCGSLHHPKPAPMQKNTPTQVQLEELGKKTQQARNQENQQFESLNYLLQAYTGAKSSEQALRTQLPENFTCSQLALWKEALHQQMRQKEQLEKNITELERQQAKRKSMGEKLAADQQNCQQQLHQAQGQIEQIVFPFSSLEEASRQKERLEAECKDFQRQMTEVSDRFQKLLLTMTQAESILGMFADQSMQDVSLEMAQVRQIHLEKQKSLGELQQTIQTLHARQQHNQRALSLLEGYLADYEQQRAQYAQIRQLTDAINGNANMNGQGKMDLETFVQAAYFEKVLEKANLRLLQMSDQRYELRRSQAASGNTRIGLDLDILDRYSMTLRSACGLSGGESFMASLALALGLSDAIQQSSGGSALETLFVDEGFGSLDQEALAKAVHTLYSLAGSRLVGIISHVETIKRQVDAQILVSQDKEGRSRAEIIV